MSAVYVVDYPGSISSTYYPATLPPATGFGKFQSLAPYQSTFKIWDENGGRFTNYAATMDQILKYGIFYAWDGFAGTYRRNSPTTDVVAEQDVSRPTAYDNDLNSLLSSYNQILNIASKPETIDYIKDPAQRVTNTYIFGPISNKTLSFGNNNNIIMMSPTPLRYNYVINELIDSEATNVPGKVIENVFYPSAQGQFQTNTIRVGTGDISARGNNIVYYDSSIKELAIKGQGSNVFVPSLGSFNLALTDFKIEGNIGAIKAVEKLQFSQTALPVQQALAPIPVGNSAQFAYQPSDLYYVVSAHEYKVQDQTSPDWSGVLGVFYEDHQTSENAVVYLGNEKTDRNGKLNPDGTFNSSSLGAVGGETLIGGSGTDIFYGIDPGFWGTLADHSLFLSAPEGETKNHRFNEQTYYTTHLYGGAGNNIFYLGNPTKLTVNGNQFKGDYSYVVRTAHDETILPSDRAKLSYASVENVSIVNVNLTTTTTSYTNSTSSYTSQEGPSASTLDTVRTGLGLASSVLGVRDTSGALILDKISPYFSKLGTAVSAASVVTGIIKTLPEIEKALSPPSPPVTISSTETNEPLGVWKQAIDINDWNPGVILQMQVNISGNKLQDTRWDQFQFAIEKSRTTSTGEAGAEISYTKAGGTSQTLFHLAALGADNSYGYYGWNFIQNKPVKITESHLDFFGQLPAISTQAPLASYTAKNGLIYSGSSPDAIFKNGAYDFYFNDPSKEIAEARKSVDTIQIKFDSSSLGWYWAPAYSASDTLKQKSSIVFGDLNDGLVPDLTNSKLFISKGGSEWTSFTFEEFSHNTEALIAALRAKTYYSTTINGKDIVSSDQANTDKLVDNLEILKEIMPDLNKLIRTGANTTLLTSLSEVTAVEKTSVNGENGAYVYFRVQEQDNPNNYNIFKMFVKNDGAGNALAPLPIEYVPTNQVNSLEDLYLMDVNQNAIIGTPVVNLMSYVTQDTFVTNLYKGVLNRTPDATGESVWVDALTNGMQRKDVLAAFYASQEHLNHISSDQEFLGLLYQDLLNRRAAPDEMTAWQNQLMKGLSLQALTEAFVNSSEFMQIIGSHSSSN